VKYKTLPPSVLFNNRLFVERDSKHRRVTTNLGLTFRNSKWSTYARTNINNSHRTDYLNLIVKVAAALVVLIFLTSFTSLFAGAALPSSVYTALWFVFDSDLYVKIMFSSSLICLVQLLISSLQHKFYKVLGLGTSDITPNGVSEVSFAQPSVIPRSLHKPILHRWLTQLNTSGDLSPLFNSVDDSSYRKIMPTFSPLYKAVSLIRRDSGSAKSILASIPSDRRELSLVNSQFISCAPALRSVVLDFDGFAPNLTGKSSLMSDEFNQWTLGSIETATSIYPNLLKTSSGLFYFTDYSTASLGATSLRVPELSHVQSAVEDQLSVIRWQRWLYKYNILHRSFLQNSTYMTQIHKLLNTGFYSDSLASRNTWSAQYFNSDESSSRQIQGLYRSVYGNYLGTQESLQALSTSTGSQLNSSNILALDNYSLSYHWFIKRFYMLSTLPANTVSFSPKLISSDRSNSRELIDSVSNLSILFDSEASLSINRAPTTSPSVSPSPLPTPSNVYLNYSDNSFFTQTRVEALKNLTKTRSQSSALFFTTRKLN
jgi:hypothetical protein